MVTLFLELGKCKSNPMLDSSHINFWVEHTKPKAKVKSEEIILKWNMNYR